MDIKDLVQRYNVRLSLYQTYRNYSRGNHELKFSKQDFSQQTWEELKSLRENLCSAVISAFVDPMEIVSWGNPQNDQIAEQLGLERVLNVAWAEAYRCGTSYIAAAKLPNSETIIYTQRADQMIIRPSDVNPSVAKLAARLWVDGKRPRITLWDETHIYEFKALSKLLADPMTGEILNFVFPEGEEQWELDEEPFLHGFDRVPVVQFKHGSEDAWDEGISILADVIPLQDALNQSLANTVSLENSYARPFWYLMNYRPTEVNNPFKAVSQIAENLGQTAPDLGQVVINRNIDTKFDRSSGQKIFTTDGSGPFGQLQPPDITRLLDVQDRYALKIGRVVGLPAYYLTQTSGDVPSGTSLRVLAERRTARIGNFQQDSTPPCKGLGELVGMVNPMIEWKDPAPMDSAEKVLVAVEKYTKLGYSLQDAITMLGERDVQGIIDRAQDRNIGGQLDLTGGLF